MYEENKYERLNQLAVKLGVPVPQAYLDIVISMPDGKVADELHRRAHSWNRNAYNIAFGQMTAKNGQENSFGAGFLSVKTTTGQIGYSYFSSVYPPFNGYIGSSIDFLDSWNIGYWCNGTDQGIVVGTGAGAESFEGFALGAIIGHGLGAGQLIHHPTENPSVSYNAGNLTWSTVWTRYFNNNSGGAINLGEIAIYSNCWSRPGWTNDFVMVTRDVIAATPIPDTAQLKITYTISLTYPA